MAVEWTKDMLLFAAMAHAARKGLTAAERSALAERFGVSEDLLLRYERATIAYEVEIGDKQWAQARLEAMRHMKSLGKEILSPELGDEILQALYRIRAETPEDEITRERKAAANAIRIALGVPTDDT